MTMMRSRLSVAIFLCLFAVNNACVSLDFGFQFGANTGGLTDSKEETDTIDYTTTEDLRVVEPEHYIDCVTARRHLGALYVPERFMPWVPQCSPDGQYEVLQCYHLVLHVSPTVTDTFIYRWAVDQVSGERVPDTTHLADHCPPPQLSHLASTGSTNGSCGEVQRTVLTFTAPGNRGLLPHCDDRGLTFLPRMCYDEDQVGAPVRLGDRGCWCVNSQDGTKEFTGCQLTGPTPDYDDFSTLYPNSYYYY